MENKKVVFKGFVGYNNEHMYCSKFDHLVVGKEYEVEKIINQKSFLTYYILKGVEGIFHCSYFDTIKKTTFLAVARNIPVVGNELKCFLVAFEDGKPSFIEDSIFVNDVEQMDSMYKVNNRYLVQVQP